ncbi:hypothetical protein FB381_2975 [Nocardioides albertanoniae]|uniref:Uncharacterized protein n=1 Tax=Nocardioides albertanoniae TaxID=1175486 RepID=A0A543A8Z8_9ACTN|nr:hypothetical protein FB381_2975 [Nocardioides albertanoniae]
MTENLYQGYLGALDRLAVAVSDAPRARGAAEAAARDQAEAIDRRHRADTERVAEHLARAKSSYRRAAGALDAEDLADLGIRLPATVAPIAGAVGPLAEAEHDQDRAVVSLAGAIGDHRVRTANQAEAARDAADALEARRAALEAARNQPPPRTLNAGLIAVAAGIVLLLLIVIIIVVM